jgi:hypothetical protein
VPNFLAPIDLNKNELRQAQIQNLASAPGTPVKGQLYYDTTGNILYFFDGTVWQSTKSGAGGPPTGSAGGDLAGSSYPNPTIAASAVTYAKIQNAAANRLLGNPTGSAAAPAEIPLSADLAFAAGSLQQGAFTGDVTKAAGALATTVTRLNGTALSGLATGLLKNTTGTGAPSIAVAADVPVVAAGGTGALNATDTSTTNARTPTGTASGDLNNTYPSPGVKGINGTTLSGLATGLLKNTTATGVPSIAAAADVPVVAGGASGPLSATDASVTNSRAPNGTATGDLSGSYPGPNVFRINGTSLAALATGIYKNTTGTGVPAIAAAADIPVVAAGTSATGAMSALSRLDQIATANLATASVGLNSQKIINLLDPTGAQDAATKNYVDSVVQGLDVHPSVRYASTVAVPGATYTATAGTSARGQFTTMPLTLDGGPLGAGNRVLVKDQATGAQNGIYVVTTVGTGANGIWDRATDFDQDAEVTAGAYVFVEDGGVNADSGWILTTNNPITVGGASGTTLTWAQFSGAGQITAGAGLTKTANTLDVGQGTGIVVGTDTIALDTTYTDGRYAAAASVVGVAKKATCSPAALAGGVAYATGEVITHNLGTRDITLAVINNASPWNAIEVDWEATSLTTATIRYNSSVINPAGYRPVIVG